MRSGPRSNISCQRFVHACLQPYPCTEDVHVVSSSRIQCFARSVVILTCKQDQRRQFPALLCQLDIERNRLQIDNFGLSLTSLEEVHLLLGHCSRSDLFAGGAVFGRFENRQFRAGSQVLTGFLLVFFMLSAATSRSNLLRRTTALLPRSRIRQGLVCSGDSGLP
jgi:hypothetical protein